MKAVITKSQYNRIKNFINETKEIKKDEVLGEKKKLTKKQLDTFDIDNDGDIEADDLSDLRNMKKITKEELKGNQKKLDKNKNNKIDSDDFKLLRKKKSMDEASDCGCGEDKDDTRYMFFSNLEQMMRQAKILLNMDEDAIEDLLNNGHDWAADHIAEAKNNMDQVFDFIMNEMNGEGEDDSWDSEEKGMINEDYLELRSIAKKLYSFLKSKGIRVILSRGNYMHDLLQRISPTGKRRIWDDTPIWDKGNTASLRSDGRFINNSEKITQSYINKQKENHIDDVNFNPEVIIQENIPVNDFSFEILIKAPKKEERNMFGTRKVVDEEKFKNYQKIILDFLKQFTDVNITENKERSNENLKVYNVSAIEPSINEGMSLKKKEQILEGTYQGRKVTLNKPFLTPDGPKKRSVYVRNDKGNVVKVNFGDPNMRIKKNIPERRKSFRARHNCANPGPRWKSRYWSCKAW